MDTVMDVVQLTSALVDIESTTGQEQRVARFLAQTLSELGWHVDEQPLGDGRVNVIARVGQPHIVLSTHFDCVPPFFASRVEGDRVFGRGACDAKGILASQLVAAERLRQSGRTDVGLLFVAGEERGSDGAKAANEWPVRGQWLINGEPTDGRLGIATKGVYRARLTATGRAAHSSLPHLGESAIDKLIDVLVAARQLQWPADDLIGDTNYSVGLINGGVAPNVISPSASAELMFRTVGDYEDVRALLLDVAGGRVTVDDVLVVPPVRLHIIDGFERAVFAYTTDVPFLTNWGTPLLFGPGSITVAHTDAECISVQELTMAVEHYQHLVQALPAAVSCGA